MVGWDTITRSRKFGGLGVRVARRQNTALLGTLVWDMLSSPDKLWVSLLQDKYFTNRNLLAVPSMRGSSVWNSIQKALSVISGGFRMKLGEGNSRVWYDPWVRKEPLCEHVLFVDIHDTALQVKDICVGGEW